MRQYDAARVRQEAFKEGSSMTWVDLLSSEAVAKQVADKAWTYLAAHGYRQGDRHLTVFVRPSESYPGTWKVLIFLPGVRMYDHNYEDVNERRRLDGVEALRGAYTSADLVQRWSSRR